MEHYRRSSHTVYDLKFHLVWITKYRKPVLTCEVAARLRELVREVCKAKDVEILKGRISRDHVHIFVSVPPHISISSVGFQPIPKLPALAGTWFTVIALSTAFESRQENEIPHFIQISLIIVNQTMHLACYCFRALTVSEMERCSVHERHRECSARW